MPSLTLRSSFTLTKVSVLPLLLSLLALSCKKDETAAQPAAATAAFMLTSTAVVNGLLLDAYKCEPKVNGIEKSLPLAWANAPAAAKAFAISMVHYPDPANPAVSNSYLQLWGIDKSVSGMAHGQAGNGPWFMGPNKDLRAISYSSPCSAGAGTHQYTVTIYALSATPASLPTQSSLSVTTPVLMSALASVTIIDRATLVFNSVTL